MEIELTLPNIITARRIKTKIQEEEWQTKNGVVISSAEIDVALGASKGVITLRFACEFGAAVLSGAAGNALYDTLKSHVTDTKPQESQPPSNVIVTINGTEVPFTPSAFSDFFMTECK